MATPKSLWIVGGVSLAWNAFGALDYVMTQTRNEAYLAGFTPEQLDYFQSFPPWADAAWALGVWGAVLGSVLLLLRSRFALHAFVVSFLGMLAGTLYHFGLADVRMDEVTGPASIALSLAIGVIALLLVLYAARMKSRGYLR